MHKPLELFCANVLPLSSRTKSQSNSFQAFIREKRFSTYKEDFELADTRSVQKKSFDRKANSTPEKKSTALDDSDSGESKENVKRDFVRRQEKPFVHFSEVHTSIPGTFSHMKEQFEKKLPKHKIIEEDEFVYVKDARPELPKKVKELGPVSNLRQERKAKKQKEVEAAKLKEKEEIGMEELKKVKRTLPQSKIRKLQLMNFDEEWGPKYERTIADIEENAFPADFASLMGLPEDLCSALKKLAIEKPTMIQAMAYKPIMEGYDVLCAAQTGTGKTLAYALPIIQQIIQMTERRRGQRARAIILVPTKELGDQVQEIFRKLVGERDFRTFVATGGNASEHFTNINKGLDVLISTPTCLIEHYHEKHIYFDDLKFLVVDEADTMFDDPYDYELKKIISDLKEKLQNKTNRTQLISVSATITKSMGQFLNSNLSDLKLVRVSTSTLHQSVPNLKQVFEFIDQEQHKKKSLLELLSRKSNRGRKTIIFTNSQERCEEVFKLLRKHGYSVDQFGGHVGKSERGVAYNKFKSGERRVLVCTDIASRGLDVMDVTHVINYDFPRSIVSYLHRIGRTARAGVLGKVTNIILSMDRPLSDLVEKALKKGMRFSEIKNKVKKTRKLEDLLKEKPEDTDGTMSQMSALPEDEDEEEKQ